MPALRATYNVHGFRAGTREIAEAFGGGVAGRPSPQRDPLHGIPPQALREADEDALRRRGRRRTGDRSGPAWWGWWPLVDKELASAILARSVGAEALLICTDVGGVVRAIQPYQRLFDRLAPDEAEGMIADGTLPAGSMGPKVEAAVGFLRAGGSKAIIASLDDARGALRGHARTGIQAQRDAGPLSERRAEGTIPATMVGIRRPRPKILAAVVVGLLTTAFPPQRMLAGAQGTGRPNVLIILTDDQRATDTLQVMPDTLKWFAQGGATYPNAVAATPLCCPARAAIMTGQFAHNNGVRTNADRNELIQPSTIQKYLTDAEYFTSIVGKYLNGWPVTVSNHPNPPHFDRWAIMEPGYRNTNWNVNGTIHNEPTYSTDYTLEKSLAFLQAFESQDDDRPWFLYVAPYAPHEPLIPEGENPGEDPYHVADVGTWAGNPAVFEIDESDKPAYVQNAGDDLTDARLQREGQLRMLLSVDDLVQSLFSDLQAKGELDNTLAFFLSDNGFLWSEHGLDEKNKPYTESIQIPFMMRWSGHVAPGVVDTRLAANIDLAPTILQAAGISPRAEYPLDGVSLLDGAVRTKILTEAWAGPNIRLWASIRTPRYQYVEYYARNETAVVFRELYVLRKDPWQLENVLGDPITANDSDAAGLASELAAARTCAGAASPTSCASVLTSPVSLCTGMEEVSADHWVGTGTADRLNGRKGRDILCGEGGKDILRGGVGSDQVLGGRGSDTVAGGRGRDGVEGGLQSDVLRGGRGRDRLTGGADRDTCRGGAGRDRLKGCEERRG